MMRESQEIIDRLNLAGRKLSKGHQKIADYISAHYEKAVFMTAVSLGEAVGVSESTVVRFASALGYEGYPELQMALQELVRHHLTAKQRFEMSADIEWQHVLNTVLSADMRNIRHTIEQIDEQSFYRAVQCILGAKTLYIVGMRAAAPLAQFFGYYLNFIFDDVRILANGNGDVFEGISRIDKQDVLVGISFPRYSTRTLEAMSVARAKGAQVLAITVGPMSPLHEAAHVSLSARTDMTSFVDSLAAPLSLINALVVALSLHRKDELNRHLKQLEEIWEAHSVYINKEKQ